LIGPGQKARYIYDLTDEMIVSGAFVLPC